MFVAGILRTHQFVPGMGRRKSPGKVTDPWHGGSAAIRGLYLPPSPAEPRDNLHYHTIGRKQLEDGKLTYPT
jgi:hypothetical protein